MSWTMLNIMTKDPNFVSVRLPDDVANWLREYATNNNMVRADKPNMGGSIIAIVRAAMQGQTISNNVGQSSVAPDVDIESMIENAIAPLLARLEAVETKLSTEATAPRKFYSSTTSESEGSSAAKVEASSSVEQLPILDAIEALPTENPLPDETLRDAIAATKKPKSTKRSAKSKAILSRSDALAIAQSFNSIVTGQNLYDWSKAALSSKSDESKKANSEKLAAVGLVATFTPENKPAWIAKMLLNPELTA